MSVLAPERPATERLSGNYELVPSPVGALEDLDRELEFLFDSDGPYASVCCGTSLTSNGSACCASKTLSQVLLLRRTRVRKHCASRRFRASRGAPHEVTNKIQWASAFSLAERLESVRLASEPLSRNATRTGRARYRRWRSMTPFATAEEELAGPEQLYGCSSDELSYAFAEPLTRLRRLLSEVDWLDDAEALVCAPEHSLAVDEDTGSDHGPLCALSPTFSAFRRRISSSIHELDRGAPGLCDPAHLIEAFERPLKYRLLDRLLPALIVNLHEAKAAGTLSGCTPEERYGDFIRRIHTADWRREFFLEYPVIARVSATMGMLAASSVVEFLSRLYSDWALIRNEFGFRVGDAIRQVHLVGDLHDRCRAVLILEFESSSKLVYKPRSIEVALHFQQLVDWVNQRGLEPRLRTMKVLSRAGYGWEEYISADACSSEHEVKCFYERQGSLMALLYAVSATDVHSENIIAARDDPVLVDHETLFQPEYFVSGETREERANRAFSASLAADALWYLGLLPSRRYARDGSPGIDISGLAGGDSSVGAVRVPTLVNQGRDDMRMELRLGENGPQQNRPMLGDAVSSVYDYRRELMLGFQKACQLLFVEKEALLAENGPLASFARDRTRVLLRPTSQYAMLLTSLGRPDFLRDGVSTDMHLDRFLSSAASWKGAPAIAEAERTDLWYGDVPAFYSRASSLNLWTSVGRRIDRLFPKSGFQVARRRIAALDERRADGLSWEIEAAIDCSIATADLDSDSSTRRQPSTFRIARPPTTSEATKVVALELADDLGRYIDRIRHDVGPYVNWPTVVDGDGAVVVQPAMGPTLHEGVSGVGLFFAYLGELLGRDEFREVAHRAQRTARRCIDSFPGHWSAGAFTGQGGYLYLLLHLASLWKDATLLEECADRAAGLQEAILDDHQYDFSGGAAGLVPVLLGLHQADPGGPGLDLAKKCGWHLVNSASSQAAGLGWVPEDDPSPALIGLGHGASGVALSLMSLYRATGESAFRRVAVEALGYERSLFDERERGWPDLRRIDDPTNHSRIAAWCHGAAGIGLARCRMGHDLAEPRIFSEIRTALDVTLDVGFGSNHSLCHGDLGNIELLLEASRLLSDDVVESSRLRLATSIVSDIAEHGYITGITQGVDSIDLLRGAAGIGYGLLRIASPERIPSVLLLDTPGRWAARPPRSVRSAGALVGAV